MARLNFAQDKLILMGTSNNNPLINKPRADTFPLSLQYISAAEQSVLRNMAVGFEVVSSNSSLSGKGKREKRASPKQNSK